MSDYDEELREERREALAEVPLYLKDKEIRALEARLKEQEEALLEIRKLACWYANIHAGPENEVHHALKVEVADIA